MRAIYEEFFKARLPVAGVSACAARLPDGMLVHQCFDRWLNPQQVRQALVHITQIFESLRRQQLAPVRMAWVFEHMRILLHIRTDHGCLALFVENRPELTSGEPEQVLDEFANLPVS